MKFRLVLVLMFVAVSLLSAGRIFVGIKSAEVKEKFGQNDLYNSVGNLASQGYAVLYYNDLYVLAVAPEERFPADFSSAIPEEDLPLDQLYLVNKRQHDDYAMPESAGTIHLDLGSSFLVQSVLNPEQLGILAGSPVTKLGPEPLRFPDRPELPGYSGEYRTDIAQLIAAVSVDSVQTMLQHLEDFQTRYARAGNRLQVAQWIQQQFLDLGITDTQLQSFSYDGTDQYNVVATIPGSVNPDEYIILGGHHDSISSNSDPYLLAPGADDNASGTVAALEMARVISQSGYQPPVSIRFVTFACEELGLWGSKHYSQEAFDSGQSIRLMINLDMIANNTAITNRPVQIMPYDGALDYADYAMQLTTQYTELVPSYGPYNMGGSDMIPFWQKGYRVLFFHEAEFSPVYHSSEDLVANLDPDYCAEVIKASLACAVFFADIPGSPEAPLALEATQISSDAFTANWEPATHADNYLLDVYTKESAGTASDLFFSEYIEGSGYRNKAMEVYNGTDSAVDLGDYTLEIYTANATSPNYAIPLSGSLLPGEVYVIAHPLANSAILSQADMTTSSLWFDGDDQLALIKNSTNSHVDIFGRIGEDPGAYWGEFPLVTANKTLIRKSHIVGGVASNPATGFPTLATEWESHAAETTAFLGSHSTYETEYLVGLHDLQVGNLAGLGITGLDPETYYYYQVRASNDYFTSVSSNEISLQTLADDYLPVELSSFSALLTAQNLINLVWTVQSETSMQGYYVLRGDDQLLDGAIVISPMINAANSSQEHSYEFTDRELFDTGTYYYWLQSVECGGGGEYHGPVSAYFDANGTAPEPDIPVITELKAVYPNPFNPVACIPFSLAVPTEVRIQIFNSRGQILRDFELGSKEPGNYRISWDGRDQQGGELASGIYQIRMKAGSQVFQRRALLLK